MKQIKTKLQNSMQKTIHYESNRIHKNWVFNLFLSVSHLTLLCTSRRSLQLAVPFLLSNAMSKSEGKKSQLPTPL